MADDEEAPMAVQIQPDIPVGKTLSAEESSDAVSVGVTVITGYLGAGKSTVSNEKSPSLIDLRVKYWLLTVM